ncbi:MAG: SlyX family protein [Spirochaetia bacterium]|nr:SlyX family protein [Spirochaetia bacterium]
MKDDEARTTAIEIKLAYAEEMIAQLNEVVIRQQKDLGVLENHVAKLEKKMKDFIDNSEGEERPNRRPPHY